MSALSSPLVLGIDLAAVRANYRFLCSMTEAKVAGVVKANAYGIGMADVVGILEDEGCPFYFVATAAEGAELRRLTHHPVAVLGGVSADEHDFYRAHRLTPVINTIDQIGIVGGWGIPAILHIDTGMNRLGISYTAFMEAVRTTPALASIDLIYVMSHFSCADEQHHPATPEQADRFKAAHEALCHRQGRYVPASLANSSGMFRNTAHHHDMVRPGMALYGLNPLPEQDSPMQPVVSLDARILQIRQVSAGESTGYGASHIFDHDAIIATVGIGYADGLPRRLGNGRGQFFYKGFPCPILGRISMDLTVIDLGAIPAASLPGPGDLVEVIGPHQDADVLARVADTIGYEILTQLSRRAVRHIKTRDTNGI